MLLTHTHNGPRPFGSTFRELAHENMGEPEVKFNKDRTHLVVKYPCGCKGTAQKMENTDATPRM